MTIPAFWSQGWTAALANHLWQSTVVVVIAWLLALALRKNHARMRYWVWMAASVKFLLPFSLLIVAGGWLRSLIAAPIAEKPVLTNVMTRITEPFPQTQFLEVTERPIATYPIHLLPSLLFAIWICGALIVILRWARAWSRIHAAVRAASPLALTADVPVLSASVSLEPGIFGIFRPVLLLPEGILKRLTPEQLRAIVAHEMCHVRRRDNLTFALHMAVEVLCWFHPAVWWIGKRLVEERERACDEAVLEADGEAAIYAEGILNVCKFYVEAPISCVSGVTGSDLKKRITWIMEEQVRFKLDVWRKLLLFTAAMLAVILPVGIGLVHAAEGQIMMTGGNGIEGQWQGTLTGPIGDRRMVVQIHKDDSGALSATVIMLDMNGPMGIPRFAASDVSFAGDKLKLSLAFEESSFDGKMSSDHNSIEGSWTGQQGTQRLLLARATPDTAWAVTQPQMRMKPMAADANPGIEVATIKPSKPGEMMMFRIAGNRLTMSNVSLQNLIMFAYDLDPKQIVNAPSWFNSDTYDIVVQPDQPGAPSEDQWGSIERKLLADRFQLKLHMEQRVLPAYILTVAKGGPKMTKSAVRALDGLGGPEGARMRPGTINAQAMSMADFTHSLRTILDRPVVDQTGLSGLWDLNLKWTPDESQFGGTMRMPPPPSDDSADAPPLYTALQEQLGLKLDSGKAQIPVLVLDHVGHPSPN